MGEKKKIIFFMRKGEQTFEEISEVDIEMGTEENSEDIRRLVDGIEIKMTVGGEKVARLLMGKFGSNNWRKYHKIPMIRTKRR